MPKAKPIIIPVSDLAEVLAQIGLTMIECSPDFDEFSINDLFEYAGVRKRDRTHMNKLVTLNQALRIMHEDSRRA